MFNERDMPPLVRLMFLGMLAKKGSGGAQELQATGNPVVFQTDLAKPLKSLILNLSPLQQGSGDPSPTNVRDIVPWTGVNLWHGGKNWYDESTYPFMNGRIWSNNGTIDSSTTDFKCSPYVPCDDIAGKTVTLNKRPSGNLIGIGFYTSKSTSDFISGVPNDNKTAGTPMTFSVPSDAKYLRFTVLTDATDIQIELGSTATAYEPYVPITETDISFPSPVYGGTLDVVSGVLTVNRALFDLGSIDWDKTNRSGFSFYYKYSILPRAKKYGNGDLSTFVCSEYKTARGADIYSGESGNYSISMVDSTPPGIRIRNDDCSTAEELKEALNGIMLVYELATPQEIQLTPAQITALRGSNTLWSDGNGDLEVTYLSK